MTLINSRFQQISNFLDKNQTSNLDIENIEALVSDIQVLTSSEKEYIEKNLVEISKGIDSNFDAKIIADKICSTLGNYDSVAKTVLEPINVSRNSGFAAEFFLICILRNNGFEQNFCYRNLEENSPKKGFDGLYTKNNEIWLVESKSAHSQNFNHLTTIKRAYSSLSQQLSGMTNNDPWENAATHAKVSRGNKSLVKSLEELSMNHMQGEFFKMCDCNLIIGSTIVRKNTIGIPTNIQEIIDNISTHGTKKEKVVMINLEDQNIFLEVMKEIANGNR